jgi:hypothetical protein
MPLCACGASSANQDDRDWTVDHGSEAGAWREVETMGDEAAPAQNAPDQTLRGVRHDLMFSPNAQPDARCNCIDVVLGKPEDPKFSWAGERPTTGAQHMAIALRTESSQCSAGGGPRRPSIQAVDVKGDDVIVVIEELGFNRPQALGAIIKKPGPHGGLYVRARQLKGTSLPYAASSNKGMCRVPHDVELSATGGRQ